MLIVRAELLAVALQALDEALRRNNARALPLAADLQEEKLVVRMLPTMALGNTTAARFLWLLICGGEAASAESQDPADGTARSMLKRSISLECTSAKAGNDQGIVGQIATR